MAGLENLDSCMTMAAYSAMCSIHSCAAKNPSLPPDKCVEFIRNTNPTARSFDYKRGLKLYSAVSLGQEWTDSKDGLMFVAYAVIALAKPWWLRLFPSGRDQVKSALDADQKQLLKNAGLFDPVPDEKVLAWWDSLCAQARSAQDTDKMKLARAAERLSLEYEKKRLASIGVGISPVWVALEDNTLGYDIKSYDVVDGHVVSRLIEVKSASRNEIYISRNEWNNAHTAQGRYIFHVWRMPAESLEEYSVEEMSKNIPIDNRSGNWQTVKVIL